MEYKGGLRMFSANINIFEGDTLRKHIESNKDEATMKIKKMNSDS